MKVLIVDDDNAVLDTFRMSFTTSEKKHIDFANTSQDAMKLLDTKKYDKVICDLRLDSDVDGFQILRKARECGVKIRVLLTAVSTPIPIEGTSATFAFRKPCDCINIRTWALTKDFDAKRILAATI